MRESHRQRMFRIRRTVIATIGARSDRIAFGWHEDDSFVAQLRVGRGFVYRTFAVVDDDQLVAEVVAWVHAESPSTS